MGMPRAGEGIGGGPARFKHGWVPVDPQIAASMERIRVKRAQSGGPKGTSFAHTRILPSTGTRFGVTQDKLAKVDLIGSIKDNGGFTYNPRTGGLLTVGKDKGFAVAVPGTERPVGRGDVTKAQFKSAVADVIQQHQAEIANGAVLGGWYSPDRDQYMVELTHILPPGDREGAIKEGSRRNQEAIFDLSTGETIPTGGTGDLRVSGLPKTPREQAAIKADQLLTDAKHNEPPITHDLQSVTEHLGGRMEGLDYKIKSQESLTRKIADKAAAKGMTIDEYGNYLSDTLRYTSMFSQDQYVSGTGGVLNDLTRRGYRLIDVQNTWSPDSPYKGINTNVIAPNGQIFELQFHTKESFDAKMAQHVLYEQERDPKLPPEVRQAATHKMKANMERVPTPHNAASLTGVALMGLPAGG